MSSRKYETAIKCSLESSFDLFDVDSKVSERDSKPEIEMKTSPELILQPIIIEKSEIERTKIEISINSIIVSFQIPIMDQVEQMLARKFFNQLMRDHSHFEIVRKVPIKGYHASFLITSKHVKNLNKQELINWLVSFAIDTPSHIKTLK
ncbi:MAG: Actin-related protein 2/3 complex subunit 4, variant 2, partial [Marteilia pararefringens]